MSICLLLHKVEYENTFLEPWRPIPVPLYIQRFPLKSQMEPAPRRAKRAGGSSYVFPE